jgi:polysaccharide chain length determinant protein (PEP-CTERM system associated)
MLTAALKSRTLIARVINEVDFNRKNMNDVSVETLINKIVKNLNVMVNDKELFVITFRYNDARIARDFVNTLVRKYIEQNISANREESSGASQFLDEQIKLFKEKMNEDKEKISQFKSAKAGIVNLDEGRIFNDAINIEQTLNELLIKRKLLEEQRIIAKKAANPAQVKLSALQTKLQEMLVVYTDSYPEVSNIKSQIEILQAEIASRRHSDADYADNQELVKIEAELKAVQEREAYLTRQLAATRSLASAVPATKSELQKLQENTETKKNMYDLLNIRQQQSEVSKQAGVQDLGSAYRIVDPAVAATFPTSPNRTRILIMGIFAGIAAGIGLVLLLDNLDSSLHQIEPLRQTGLPVMAVIPLIKSDEEINAQKASDIKFYLAASGYFSFILMILLLEVMKIPLFDRLFSRINLPAVVLRALDNL